MRVLFTTWAWPSHFYAQVQLAWACRTAGHEVLVASQPKLLDEIIRTGLPAVAVGPDVDNVEIVRGFVLPSAAEAAGIEQTPRTGKGPRAMQMIMANAESMMDGLVEVAKQWRADVLVFEPTMLATPIAAAAVGMPSVRHLFGSDLLVRARPLLPDVLAPLAERHGVGEYDPFGVATVDPAPASLQGQTEYRRLPMRYVPFNGSGARPNPLPPTNGRPRVCVSWGHTMAKLDPALFLAGQVVSAISELDVEVVAAISSAQRELLTDVPDNVTVLVDVPLQHVLGDCDLVVGHGGAGTVLTTLSFGLPLLLIPQLPDHLGHSGRVQAAGAGVLLPREDVGPERLRTEVERLLGDEPAREAAGKLSQEMHQQPAPSAVVAELETIARVGV